MEPLLRTLRGFGRTKLALMAAVTVAVIAAFAMIALHVSSPSLAPLYANLSTEDSAKVATELGKLSVPYEVRNNGADIYVPSERVLKLRMTMAEAGLPSNGSIVGYEIFDKSETFGSSQFVMNVNIQRALEGELARTIGSFNSVESARVHLVLPKQEIFAKEMRDPSASVAIKLRGGQELSKHEIAAITHFVAAAVPGLKPSRITVVDSYGRLLARGDGDEGIGAMASMTDEYRTGYENHLRDTLENLIEKVVGPGRVKVQVAADMNFDRITIDSEKFDPDGQVARSTQSTSERDSAQEADQKAAVTVANQLPGGQGAGQGGQNSQHSTDKTDETTNYEISKVVQRQIKEGGNINKLSVAALVDGNYTDEKDGAKTYAPRTAEELAHIEDVIKSAIPYDAKRGDTVRVINMPFSKVETTAEKESFLASFRHEFEGIIQTLIIAGVVVLAILVILKPAIQHLMRLSASASERTGEGMAAIGGPAGPMAIRLPGAAAAGGTAGGGGFVVSGGAGGAAEEEESMIDLDNVKGRVRSSTLRKVVDIVDKNPDEAMGVMRQWMTREAT
ncbi:MAG: flagellar M-ring protein FliF [Alphaproteobacteria bacterium]|nr:flagellar M-ring protein FliF [Alphaproteobacteria bacterium]